MPSSVIEFTGLPGSGKTTIRRGLLARLRASKQECFLASEEAFTLLARRKGDRPCRLILNLVPPPLASTIGRAFINRTLMQFNAQGRFLARHGQALRAFLESQAFAKMEERDRVGVLESFLQVGSLTTLVDDDLLCGRAVLFEEGLVQKSLMFIDRHGTPVEEKLVEAYLDAVPKPTIVVAVSADTETCRERTMNRRQGRPVRLREANECEVASFLERAAEHLGRVIPYLKLQGGVRVVAVDGTAPLDRVSAELESRLRGILRLPESADAGG